MTEPYDPVRGGRFKQIGFAALGLFLLALLALAYLGADLVWWVGAWVVLMLILSIVRRAAPPGFVEAQKRGPNPTRRDIGPIALVVVGLCVAAAVLGYLGALSRG